MRHLIFAVVIIASSVTNTFAATGSFATENVLVRLAKKFGVSQCLPAIKKVSDFLIENDNVGDHTIWNTKNPDKQIFTSLIEKSSKEGTFVTNLTVAPVQSGECVAVYEQIMHESSSCFAVSRDAFADYDYYNVVDKKVTVLKSKVVNANQAFVYLLPSEGGGCLIIKKQVIMDASSD